MAFLDRLQLLPLSLLVVLVAGTTTPISYTNTSSSSQPATGCNSCTVTAFEIFLTYPSAVSTTEVLITQTVIPYVTENADGSKETNLVTIVGAKNVTVTQTEAPQPTDPFAALTWEVNNVTLTYPTTYVEFSGLIGGTFFPVTTSGAATCTFDNKPLTLPAGSDTSLIVPVTGSVDVANPTFVTVPHTIMTWLDSIPAVASQFGNTPVADCSWTKIPVTTETPEFSLTETSEVAGSTEVPVQKISVSILTQVTAAQVVITRSTDTATNDGPSKTPAIVHVESSAGGLDTPQPTPTTTAGQASNAPVKPVAQQTGGQGTQSNVQGTTSQAPSPTSLVVTLGGKPTTIAPTVIPGSTSGNSVTAFVIAPGTTLTAGGSAITVSGKVISAPAGGVATSAASPTPFIVTLAGSTRTIIPTVIPGTKAGSSITAFVLGPGETLTEGGSPITLTTGGSTAVISAPSASTSGGGVGGAIASGIGYTGPVSTGGASFLGPNVSLWLFGGLAGVCAVFAVGL